MTIPKLTLSLVLMTLLHLSAGCSEPESTAAPATPAAATPAPQATATDPASESVASSEPVAAQTLDHDIVGLKLGMTMAEAREVLAAHGPRMRISDAKEQIAMRDSRQMSVTLGEYVNSINAYWGNGVQGWGDDGNRNTETIGVYLSGPPGEPRVYRIDRSIRYAAGAGPTMASMSTALTDKYGAHSYAKDTGGVHDMQWYADGNEVSANESLAYGNFVAQPSQLLRVRADLALPIKDPGPALRVYTAAPGQSVTSIASTLMASLQTIGELNLATSEYANSLREAHEAKLLEAASQKEAPTL